MNDERGDFEDAECAAQAQDEDERGEDRKERPEAAGLIRYFNQWASHHDESGDDGEQRDTGAENHSDGHFAVTQDRREQDGGDNRQPVGENSAGGRRILFEVNGAGGEHNRDEQAHSTEEEKDDGLLSGFSKKARHGWGMLQGREQKSRKMRTILFGRWELKVGR